MRNIESGARRVLPILHDFQVKRADVKPLQYGKSRANDTENAVIQSALVGVNP